MNSLNEFYRLWKFKGDIKPIAMGLLIFGFILLTFQNNPIRWLNVVEKYQKRKLKIIARKETTNEE